MNPNVFPSLIAIVSRSSKISFDGYSGKSNWFVLRIILVLYHVCAVGNLSKFLSNVFAILNLLIPPIPDKFEKPSKGTFDEPNEFINNFTCYKL